MIFNCSGGGEKEIRDLVSPPSLPNKSPWGKIKIKKPPGSQQKKKRKEIHTLKSFFHVLKGLVSIGEESFNFAFGANVFSYHPSENYVCCLKYSFEWSAILLLLSSYSFHMKKSKRRTQAALHGKKSRPEFGRGGGRGGGLKER